MGFMRFGGFMRCIMRNVLNPKRIRSGFKTKPLEAISMKQSRKVERMSMRLWGATQRDTLYKLLKMQLRTFQESIFSMFGVFQSEILWDVHLQAFDQTAVCWKKILPANGSRLGMGHPFKTHHVFNHYKKQLKPLKTTKKNISEQGVV